MKFNSLITGFIGTIAIFGISMGPDLSMYMQWHSIIIVVGGSITILLFATPSSVLKNLWLSLKKLFQPDEDFHLYRQELVELSKRKTLEKASNNPLVGYAVELWEQGISADLFIVLLSQKRNEIISQKTDSVQSLKNLSKYPPALGMAGTVMGMIALFNSLDSNKDSIGENLALAMTATFFGLILTNAVISPLADRLQVKQVHFQRFYTSLYEILLLINQGEPTSLISEEVSHRAA